MTRLTLALETLANGGMIRVQECADRFGRMDFLPAMYDAQGKPVKGIGETTIRVIAYMLPEMIHDCGSWVPGSYALPDRDTALERLNMALASLVAEIEEYNASDDPYLLTLAKDRAKDARDINTLIKAL